MQGFIADVEAVVTSQKFSSCDRCAIYHIGLHMKVKFSSIGDFKNISKFRN